jgi:hypothetical protein
MCKVNGDKEMGGGRERGNNRDRLTVSGRSMSGPKRTPLPSLIAALFCVLLVPVTFQYFYKELKIKIHLHFSLQPSSKTPSLKISSDALKIKSHGFCLFFILLDHSTACYINSNIPFLKKRKRFIEYKFCHMELCLISLT